MHKFNSASVEIAYNTVGEGEPILLIHGFASNGRVNWEDTGWVRTLVNAGYRVITIDNRGHGNSEKLYQTDAYAAAEMAEDASRLLTHLQIHKCHIMGYSMGARISAFLSINHPEQVHDVVFGGLAGHMLRGLGGAKKIAEGLLADNKADITDAGAKLFRNFAEQTKSDLKALAACIASSRGEITAEMLQKISCPVLVVAGSEDTIAGPLEPMLALIPQAEGHILPGRNHMNAVGDRGYKDHVLAFLQNNPLN